MIVGDAGDGRDARHSEKDDIDGGRVVDVDVTQLRHCEAESLKESNQLVDFVNRVK